MSGLHGREQSKDGGFGRQFCPLCAKMNNRVWILCKLLFLLEAFFPGFYFKIRSTYFPGILTGETSFMWRLKNPKGI